MIESYFFIPSNSKKYIEKVNEIQADNFVFDLEDSITSNDLELAIGYLLDLDVSTNFLVRIPSLEFVKTESFLRLTEKGFKRYIIPKANTPAELSTLRVDSINGNGLSYIILVENPKLMLQLSEILEKYNDLIEGVALGSHDYASGVGMEHTYSNLKYPRDYVFTLAKAYSKEVIDIASMEVKDLDQIHEEILSAFKGGYSSKFFIHPNQLKVLKTIGFYDEKEVEFARKILEMVGDNHDFKPFVVDGMIIEKPHLNRYKRIIDWYENKRT